MPNLIPFHDVCGQAFRDACDTYVSDGPLPETLSNRRAIHVMHALAACGYVLSASRATLIPGTLHVRVIHPTDYDIYLPLEY